MVNKFRAPRGSVNLERSYEICRSVVQKSVNRSQIETRLRPLNVTEQQQQQQQQPQQPQQMAIINTSNGQRAAVAIQQIRAVTPGIALQQQAPVQVVVSQAQQQPPRVTSAPGPGSIVVVSSGVQGSGNVIRLAPQQPQPQQQQQPTILLSTSTTSAPTTSQQQVLVSLPGQVRRFPASPSPPPTRLIPISQAGTRLALRPAQQQQPQQQIIIRQQPGLKANTALALPQEPIPPSTASTPSPSPRSTPSPQLVALPTQPLPPSSSASSSSGVFQKPLPVSSPGPTRLLANASPVKMVTIAAPGSKEPPVNTPLPKAIQLPSEPVPMKEVKVGEQQQPQQQPQPQQQQVLVQVS